MLIEIVCRGKKKDWGILLHTVQSDLNFTHEDHVKSLQKCINPEIDSYTIFCGNVLPFLWGMFISGRGATAENPRPSVPGAEVGSFEREGRQVKTKSRKKRKNKHR